MALAYGESVNSYDDPLVQSVIRCLTRMGNAARPGYWKVDAFPFLKYITPCFSFECNLCMT
jgi:hypothetical protein